MKITFLGYDYTLDIAQRLMADGHDIIHIYTFPCDGLFAFNNQINEFADYFKIPISEHKIAPDNINTLINQGCDLFLCAGYPYKIPEISPKAAYSINMHPTMLPRARGIMPLPFIIMQENTAAGFTIHKLMQNFDAGDILYQEAVIIDEHTDVETLSAMIATRAPDAISNIVNNIKGYWDNATAQDECKSSSYLTPSNEMRNLKWDETASILRKKGQAFGRFGVMATIENDMGTSQQLAVFNFTTWEENHKHRAGKLIRSSPREIVISIKDGYICLKEFQVIA